ncbi:MAG: TIGR03545 family protein [Bdellovibrionales bacterium]
MTNSTELKKKGPIRTGAVVPSLILIVIIGVYFTLFFDGNLRRGLEYAGTHINGAEVNVARVATSFIHASLEINGIQMTDKEHPERNTVEVGAIKFQMSWDALLRAKILVDEASILNIQALTKRTHPGYVVPPPPPEVKDGKPTALDKVQQEVAAEAKKKYNGNFLGDVAGILGGADPKDQLKNIQGELKSDAKIKALEKELAEKKVKWDARIKALPQGKELQAYGDRIKALKFDFKNPGELAKNVAEAQKIINEAQDKVKLIDQTQKDLKGDVNTYQQAYKDLEKMVQEDIRDMQSRLKLPNIDAKEFSQQLFMNMIEKKLGSMAKYVELARQYAPPKKTAEQKAAAKAENVVPPKRGAGKNYRFPITTGYPLFWLKHAAISSEVSSSEYSGNIKGEIKDLTTDPPFIGRPTLILVHGDFPKQDIHGLDAKITLDHTTDIARESMIAKVAHFPVAETKLSDSPDVRLGLQKASGESEVTATFVNQEITMATRNNFNEIKYDLEAKNKVVQDLIDAVLKGIPVVNVNADIKGSFHDFDVHINSNLGDELSKGFQKQLQAKINEAKDQLKKMVDAKIGGDRDKLKGDLDKFTGGLTKDVDGKKGEADKVVKDAQNQLNSQKGSGQKKLEEEGKKLLKGFGL